MKGAGLPWMFGLVFAGALSLAGAHALWAEPSQKSETQRFSDATAALGRGEYSAAIDEFEALADTGFAHPDASYNRGLAYVMRVTALAERTGDLGQAAAAFEETLRMRPGDADAENALDTVRAEVTRRRSRKAKDDVDVRPTLDRLLVRLGSEQSFGLSAVVASILLALGMLFRRRPEGAAHIAGSILAPTAFAALLALIPLTWKARDLRLHTRPAVVIAPEVYFTDENGKAIGGDPIPEAAGVESHTRTEKRTARLVFVRWGAQEGWIPASGIRLLAQ